MGFMLVGTGLLGCASETTLLDMTHLPAAINLAPRPLLHTQNVFNLSDYSQEYAKKKELEATNIAHFAVFAERWYPPKKPWYPVAYLELKNDGSNDERVIQEFVKGFVLQRIQGTSNRDALKLASLLVKPAKYVAKYQKEANLAATLLHKAKQAAYALGADFLVLQKTSKPALGFTLSQGGVSHQMSNPTVLRAVAGKYARVDFAFILGKNNTIAYVKSGSHAEKAGLREGYQILTLDGEYLGDTPYIITQVLARKKAGDLLRVEYLAKGLDKGHKTKKKIVYTLPAAQQHPVPALR